MKGTQQSVNSIQIHNLWLKRGASQLFQDFSYCFEAEKVTALMASSGLGKTSLLDCIAGLLQPDEGWIQCDSSVSYLFQEPRLLPWYSLEKNVMLPMESLLGHQKAQERSKTFLQAVHLEDKANALPAQCSGGQRQRCAIARAFAFPSTVLLMDEAFQFQDIKLKLQLMELTEKLLKQEGRTAVLVTHDVSEALALAHRVVVLAGSPLQVVGEFEGASKSQPMAQRYIHRDAHSAQSREAILKLLCES
jgi:NitT/TauT family transport system ATP-binding protein